MTTTAKVIQCLEDLVKELEVSGSRGPITAATLSAHINATFPNAGVKPAQVSHGLTNFASAGRLTRVGSREYFLPSHSSESLSETSSGGETSASFYDRLCDVLASDPPEGPRQEVFLYLNGTDAGNCRKLLSAVERFCERNQNGQAGKLLILLLSPTRHRERYERVKYRRLQDFFRKQPAELREKDRFGGSPGKPAWTKASFEETLSDNFQKATRSTVALCRDLTNLHQLYSACLSIRLWDGPALEPRLLDLRGQKPIHLTSLYRPSNGCGDGRALDCLGQRLLSKNDLTKLEQELRELWNLGIDPFHALAHLTARRVVDSSVFVVDKLDSLYFMLNALFSPSVLDPNRVGEPPKESLGDQSEWIAHVWSMSRAFISEEWDLAQLQINLREPGAATGAHRFQASDLSERPVQKPES